MKTHTASKIHLNMLKVKDKEIFFLFEGIAASLRLAWEPAGVLRWNVSRHWRAGGLGGIRHHPADLLPARLQLQETNKSLLSSLAWGGEQLKVILIMESLCSLEILIQTSENLKCKKGVFQFVEASGSGWRTSSYKLEHKYFWCQAAVKEGVREKVIRQDKALVVHRRLWPFFQEKRFWPRGCSGPELLHQTLNNSLTSDLRMRFRIKCLSLNTSGFIPARGLYAKTYLAFSCYQASVCGIICNTPPPRQISVPHTDVWLETSGSGALKSVHKHQETKYKSSR